MYLLHYSALFPKVLAVRAGQTESSAALLSQILALPPHIRNSRTVTKIQLPVNGRRTIKGQRRSAVAGLPGSAGRGRSAGRLGSAGRPGSASRPGSAGSLLSGSLRQEGKEERSGAAKDDGVRACFNKPVFPLAKTGRDIRSHWRTRDYLHWILPVWIDKRR
jgi:hypothetical protein